MKKINLLLILCAISTSPFAAEVAVEGCASATIIESTATIADFESLAGNDTVRRSAPYVEDGFELTTEWENTGMNAGQDKFSSVHTGSEFYAGSVSFITHFSDDFPILTKQNGESFDLDSIDLDSLFLESATVEFTGTKAAGGTITQSFTTDSTRNHMETFHFAGFDDLVSVSWESPTPTHYDNIVVDMPGAIGGFTEQCISLNTTLETDPNDKYKRITEDQPLNIAWGGCNTTGVDVNYTMENRWRYSITAVADEGERASAHMRYGQSPTYRNTGAEAFVDTFSGVMSNGICVDGFSTLLVGFEIATGLDPHSLRRDENVRGLFFDVDNPGHGFDFNFLTAGFQLFYYGHTREGERLWLLSDPVNMNIEYGQPVELKLYEVPIGTYGLPDNSSTVSWGIMEVTFSDCKTAHVFMQGDDGNLSLNLVRLAHETGYDCL